jgi:hypothetical protein
MVVKLIIPDGYKIDYLPEESNLYESDFSYSVSYQSDDKSITFSRKININTLVLKKSEFLKWDNVVSKFQDISRNVVVLKKI